MSLLSAAKKDTPEIIHIAPCDTKFMLPFVAFINDHFDGNKHQYLFLPHKDLPVVVENHQVKMFKFSAHLFKNLWQLYKAKKIILHSLMSRKLIIFLFFQPWLLKKCYWIMWGADLYKHLEPKNTWRQKFEEYFRRRVIKKIRFFLTGTQGDYEYAKQWYGINGHWIKCFNYPSNLYKSYEGHKRKAQEPMRILMGNSGTPSNNHHSIFDQLKKFSNENVEVYCPLSYGEPDYIESVIKTGHEVLGDKFKPIKEFMPFDSYVNLLKIIDIGLFAHQRQQGFGNIITLLGMGKKVFVNKKSTLNGVFIEYDLKVYDYQSLDISPLDELIAQQNISTVRAGFSEEALIKSLSKWVI